MLISVLSFGSVWARRVAKSAQQPARFSALDTAYYNTTGVLVGDTLRNRPCVYGVARFNGSSGFRPDCMHQMVQKIFECEPPCVWNGHNKVLFKALVAGAEKSGGINREQPGGWLQDGAQLISFSECGGKQEVMLVMPPYTWVRGRLGTFFMEPVTQT